MSEDTPGNFIEEIVDEELAQGKYARIVTRFPPEPNGYLHIGHAKALALNFGLADKTPDSRCNLRFDDTNPEKESTEYVEAIQRDVAWLGFSWGEKELYASDYFGQLYEWAEKLVQEGKAYVDSQSPEEIRESRGDFHRPGVNSPYRDRPAEESLDLLRRMRAGELPDGSHVLRAKIDMQSADLKLRDPLMYRIRHAHHHRTGDDWCIYPMYDWAHGQSDAIEGVTHSLCSLEFQNHRPLYDWFLTALGFELPNRPKQIEFAKLAITYTVLSKRRLLELVESAHVDGWDDPRMPTLSGMRRRGFTPEGIRKFCERIGVARRDNVVEIELLEHAVREDLNATSARAMAVLRPLKVVLENFPEGEIHEVELMNHPEHPEQGTRKVPFGRELWIEREDFEEIPPKKWFRLSPGAEVRLRGAALITCKEVVKNAAGEVVELRCTWDEQSRGGTPADGRKVKGTLHWVSAAHAIDADVRLYDRLFTVEDPTGDGGGFLQHLNPSSLELVTGAKLEPVLGDAAPGARYQFERLGYFCRDRDGAWNRTITLRDTWAKIAKKG